MYVTCERESTVDIQSVAGTDIHNHCVTADQHVRQITITSQAVVRVCALHVIFGNPCFTDQSH